MAKGRLSKSEKYVIEGMFEDGHSFEEIAVETGRTGTTIEKHLRTVARDAVEPDPPQENKGLFVRKTAAKNNKGVSIMTEAESTRGEKKAKGQSKIKKRFQPIIHTIKNNK